MSVTAGFLVYVTLFRLTVLGVGALAVYLGYRLFIQGSIGRGGKADATSANATSASAEGGGFKVTLTNFWPGAYFALFGTVIIGIMLWQGTPELLLTESSMGTSGGSSTQLRGSASEVDIDQQWERLSEHGLTLSAAARPLGDIARLWRHQGRTGEALAMARLATFGQQDDPALLVLFAELLMDNDNAELALVVMRKAVARDPSYRDALRGLQRRAAAGTD